MARCAAKQSGDDVAGPSTTDTTPPPGAVHALLLAAACRRYAATDTAPRPCTGRRRGCVGTLTARSPRDQLPLLGVGAAMATSRLRRRPTAGSAGAVPDEPSRHRGGSIFDEPAAGTDAPADDRSRPQRRPLPQNAPPRGRKAADSKTAAIGPKRPAIHRRTGAERAHRRAHIDSADGRLTRRRAHQAIEGLNMDRGRPIRGRRHQVGFILKPTLEQGVTVTSNADSSTQRLGRGAVGNDAAPERQCPTGRAIRRRSTPTASSARPFRARRSTTFAGGIDGALELELGKDYRGHRHARLCETARNRRRLRSSSSGRSRSRFARPDRQPRPREGCRQGALRRHRRASSSDLYGDAELECGGVALAEGPQFDAVFDDAARRLRDFAGADAFHRNGSRSPPLRVQQVERRLCPFVRPRSRLAPAVARSRRKACPARSRPAGFARDVRRRHVCIPISGPTIDAAVSWSPVRGTIVDLIASTTVEGTTTAGESGSILYAGAFALSAQIRANLTGNAVLGAGWRDYTGSDGHDLILSAEAGLTWWLNRYAGLTGRVRHESLKSNLPDRDSETNSIFLGRQAAALEHGSTKVVALASCSKRVRCENEKTTAAAAASRFSARTLKSSYAEGACGAPTASARRAAVRSCRRCCRAYPDATARRRHWPRRSLPASRSRRCGPDNDSHRTVCCFSSFSIASVSWISLPAPFSWFSSTENISGCRM